MIYNPVTIALFSDQCCSPTIMYSNEYGHLVPSSLFSVLCIGVDKNEAQIIFDSQMEQVCKIRRA